MDIELRSFFLYSLPRSYFATIQLLLGASLNFSILSRDQLRSDEKCGDCCVALKPTKYPDFCGAVQVFHFSAIGSEHKHSFFNPLNSCQQDQNEASICSSFTSCLTVNTVIAEKLTQQAVYTIPPKIEIWHGIEIRNGTKRPLFNSISEGALALALFLFETLFCSCSQKFV